MASAFPPTRQRQIRDGVLAWYARHQRDLPWRRTADPYRIWLSEAMLQQTRVETVVPYYQRFLARFPDVQALADADEQDVLKQWEGLGYYSRARNLKRAAEIVVREHGGELPSDPDALRALPGVGPYTVGAIRSIAFKQPAALVDGNVKRVLSRLLAPAQPSERELWDAAGELVPDQQPDAFNQGLMELGATLCLPRAPLCGTCPLGDHCGARVLGRPEQYPSPKPRKPPREVRALGGVLRRPRSGELLLVRRPGRGLLGGLWEVPSIEGDSVEVLLTSIEERTGLRASPLERLGEVRHLFTHRALRLGVVALAPRGRLRGQGAGDARWCDAAQIAELPLSRLMHKVLELARAASEGRS